MNGVIGQSIIGAEMDERSHGAVKKVQTAAVGADPEATAAVFQQAVDIVAAYTGLIAITVTVIPDKLSIFRIKKA